MIIDKIKNISLYKGLGKRLDLAFDYITNGDFSNLKAGKYQIDGDEVFFLMNEYETKLNKAEVLEAHKKYIDVQYILTGEEVIEYTPLRDQVISREYDSENDYAFYYSEQNIQLTFKAGMFAIFLPEDLHMPGVVSNHPSIIKKIVVKVLID
jgi:YhcH/YjgK/YiaL family protein